jgi:hypothetical protein
MATVPIITGGIENTISNLMWSKITPTDMVDINEQFSSIRTESERFTRNRVTSRDSHSGYRKITPKITLTKEKRKKRKERKGISRVISKIYVEEYCCVCVDEKSNVIIKPCNHKCICNICYKKFLTRYKLISKTRNVHFECPYCSTKIENVIKD